MHYLNKTSSSHLENFIICECLELNLASSSSAFTCTQLRTPPPSPSPRFTPFMAHRSSGPGNERRSCLSLLDQEGSQNFLKDRKGLASAQSNTAAISHKHIILVYACHRARFKQLCGEGSCCTEQCHSRPGRSCLRSCEAQPVRSSFHHPLVAPALVLSTLPMHMGAAPRLPTTQLSEDAHWTSSP